MLIGQYFTHITKFWLHLDLKFQNKVISTIRGCLLKY